MLFPYAPIWSFVIFITCQYNETDKIQSMHFNEIVVATFIANHVIDKDNLILQYKLAE